MSTESATEAPQRTSSREMQAIRVQSLLNIIQAWLPVLTVVGGALWALYTYLDHQTEVQREAAALGFRRAIVPRSNLLEPAKVELDVRGVATVGDALTALLG